MINTVKPVNLPQNPPSEYDRRLSVALYEHLRDASNVINRLAVNAGGPYLYFPISTGAPSGTPTPPPGFVAGVVDETSNKFYLYVGGGWKSVTLA